MGNSGCFFWDLKLFIDIIALWICADTGEFWSMATTACFIIVSRNDIPIYEAEVGSTVKVRFFPLSGAQLKRECVFSRGKFSSSLHWDASGDTFCVYDHSSI